MLNVIKGILFIKYVMSDIILTDGIIRMVLSLASILSDDIRVESDVEVGLLDLHNLSNYLFIVLFRFHDRHVEVIVFSSYLLYHNL